MQRHELLPQCQNRPAEGGFLLRTGLRCRFNVNVREPGAFARYLAAKRTVDDRAVNRGVFEALRKAILRIPKPGSFLEVGAGIGTGFIRLLDEGLFQERRGGHYDLLEREPETLAEARRRLGSVSSPLTLGFHNQDIEDFARQADRHGAYDVLIAHAVIDLLDAARVVPKLIDLVRVGGALYFPITFDGVTVFEPEHTDDDTILSHYHSTMDKAGGDSRAGRHLFHALTWAGADILAAGSSDWVVFPTEGTYPADEACFLAFIIETIRTAVAESSKELAETVHAWADLRRASIEAGELVYIAHQLDYLCKKSESV